MNRKAVYKVTLDREELFGLLVCVIFFLSGGIVGTFSARSLDEAGTLALQLSMAGYIGQITEGMTIAPGFWSTLWVTGRDHLLVLFLGFSLLGALCLPLVAAVKGFYLSFSIAVFIRAFGTGGWPVAFALFGLGALITIPCFFILASQAFATSSNLGKTALGAGKLQAGTLYDRRYTTRIGFSALGILGAVLLELYLTPALVVWTSSFL